MGSVSYDLAIAVIAILAVAFILLGVFYRAVASLIGMDEGTAGHRFLAVVIGLALFGLLWVYRLARESMAAI